MDAFSHAYFPLHSVYDMSIEFLSTESYSSTTMNDWNWRHVVYYVICSSVRWAQYAKCFVGTDAINAFLVFVPFDDIDLFDSIIRLE